MLSADKLPFLKVKLDRNGYDDLFKNLIAFSRSD